MRFFTKMFRGDGASDESRICEQLVPYFRAMGATKRNAITMAGELVEKAKQRCVADGSIRQAPKAGDRLLSLTSSDDALRAMVEAARADGATDEDLRWWWNMPALMRAVLMEQDNLGRTATWLGFIEEGASPEVAAVRTNKIHPRYGDPMSEEGEDRPLPIELKRSVVEFVERRTMNPQKFRRLIDRYSSFNALIRTGVRKSKI